MRNWEYPEKKPRRNLRGFCAARRKKRRYIDRTQRKIDWRYLLPALALLCVFAYAAVHLMQYARQSQSVQRTNENVQVVYAAVTDTPAMATHTPAVATPVPAATPAPPKETPQAYQMTDGEITLRMAELKKINADTVGWLRIPGVVDLPVVYRDNEYYLDHDFYGQKSAAGTLFLDENHPLRADTQYLLVHGHNMNDGSMFGLLSHYRGSGYMQQHPTVYFDTLFRKEKYEVIGVLCVPADVRREGYVAYAGTRRFADEEHFRAFVREITENALHWKRGAEIQNDDALLALSTCYEDERIVVMCRRVD